MAVPKKKVSKSRRDSRRAHNFRLVAPNLIPCPNCKAPTLPHRVCPTCGYYQGRQVINKEAEAAQ
ncbi:large subunit ribosomal protein L32 [Symbiobacterium terraclitae]|uniref:Large ribosomal subunit protein bL32 n=1 Tax=Symbiobacterium terraclitae TaxID=557451 RepID=A0ABS4JUP0_9FIRM|nr:50S ribosomal protein L32 [Symbiobacterium terraclitae]MBP2019256.1 large subunit ribosomal protein L32 [Symbiobacterium terraclitae]